eukprot:scaffold1453_cov195-Amphora_coffeaeformis.AAC.10
MPIVLTFLQGCNGRMSAQNKYDKDNFRATFFLGETTAAAANGRSALDRLRGVAGDVGTTVHASETLVLVQEESVATAVMAARPAPERVRIPCGVKKRLERHGEVGRIGRPSCSLWKNCMEKLPPEERSDDLAQLRYTQQTSAVYVGESGLYNAPLNGEILF